MTWAVMMLSLTVAGVASTPIPRVIAAGAGCCALITGLAWAWGNWSGRLPEPALQPLERDPHEVRAQPRK